MRRVPHVLPFIPLLLVAGVSAPALADVAAEAIALPAFDPAPLHPAPDTAVPANGRVVWRGADVADMTFVRIDDAGAESDLPFTREETVTEFDIAYVVDVSAVPAGSLTVEARCNACFPTPVSYLIEEGDDVTAPLFSDDDQPVLTVTPLGGGFLFEPQDQGFFVELRLPNLEEDRGDTVLLRVESDDPLVDGIVTSAPESDVYLPLTINDGTERTVCFTAIAVDAAGNETAFGEEQCAELVRPRNVFGCGQSQGDAPVVAGALMLALLAARRRKS